MNHITQEMDAVYWRK